MLTREPANSVSSDLNETWIDGKSVSENPTVKFSAAKSNLVPLRGFLNFKTMHKKI